MSYSNTVTKEDLKNVLNEVLPSPTLNPWALLDASGFTGNNTATKVTGTTTQSGGNASEYFDTSTPDQITIKKAGLYKVTCVFGLSATSNASNVKRIACYANGSESAVAMSRTQSWENNVMSFVTRTYSKDDVLTMYRRAEDGNSTYSQATILIEALHASSGNVRAEADYIVEEGTDGIWTYRKWNSGVAECWGSVDTYTSFVAWTSPIYYGSTYSANQTYPTNLFIETPKLNVSCYMTGGNDVWVSFGYSGGIPSATKTGRYFPLRVGAGSAGTFTTQFYAIGKWK